MIKRLTKRGNFDDEKASIQKRIQNFQQKTLPVVEKYCHKVVKVNANRPAEQVLPDLLLSLQGELEAGGRPVIQ